MVTWIVLGVVLFALLVLGLAVRAVAARLPELRRAALRLRQRQAEAEELRGRAEALRERAEALRVGVVAAQRRVAVIKARRGR